MKWKIQVPNNTGSLNVTFFSVCIVDWLIIIKLNEVDKPKQLDFTDFKVLVVAHFNQHFFFYFLLHILQVGTQKKIWMNQLVYTTTTEKKAYLLVL